MVMIMKVSVMTTTLIITGISVYNEVPYRADGSCQLCLFLVLASFKSFRYLRRSVVYLEPVVQ